MLLASCSHASSTSDQLIHSPPQAPQIILVDIVESGPDGERMSVDLDNQMIVDQVV